MNARLKFFLVSLLGVVILFTILVWLAPRIFESMPGEIRGRVPESIVMALTTPLPTALPLPGGANELESMDFQMPLLPTATELSKTPLPTSTSTAVVIPEPTAVIEITRTMTATPIPTITPTEISLPVQAVIDDLRIVPQKFNNCGPANLMMVLNYYDLNADQLEIGAKVKPNYDDRNVSPYELVEYVRIETEFQAMWFSSGDQFTLKRLIANGYPVIVEKGLYLDENQGWMGHYLTLIGYDENQQAFLSQDSFLGPWDNSGREIAYESFDRYWHQFNRTFIVVFPPDKKEDIVDILGEESITQESFWQRAATNAHEGVLEDSNSAFSWFNLGTNLTHLAELSGEEDHYRTAAEAFDRAFSVGLPWRMLWYQFKPYVAYMAIGRFDDVITLTDATLSNSGGQNVEETYLYRGHALMALNEPDAARRSYEKALRLNPNYVEAQEALEAMLVNQ